MARIRSDFSPARFCPARLQVPWPRPAQLFDLMFSNVRQTVLTAHAVKVTIATALLAAVAACSDGTSTGPIVPEGKVLLPTSSTSVQPIFQQMKDAMFAVPFAAQREIQIHSGPNPTQFRENIASDGQGNLFYRSGDVSSLHHGDPDMMEILLNLRRRQSLLYRDPVISDVDLFTANYRVVDMGTNPVVAGVPCVRMHISRLAGDERDPHFELSVDPVTGMTMAWDEVDFQGTVLGSMEVLDFTAGAPDTTGLLPVTEQLTKDALKIWKPLGVQVDHPVLAPTLLPPGFQLVTASRSFYDDGVETAEFIRQEFSDGFETVVLMHKAPTLTTLEARFHPGSVQVETMSSWTFVTGEILTCEVILAGRVSEARLLSMLASSF